MAEPCPDPELDPEVRPANELSVAVKGEGDSLPKVDWLLWDRGHVVDWFLEALKDNWIRACIPGRKQRETAVKNDKRRNRIENMYGRLKD